MEYTATPCCYSAPPLTPIISVVYDDENDRFGQYFSSRWSRPVGNRLKREVNLHRDKDSWSHCRGGLYLLILSNGLRSSSSLIFGRSS